MIRSDAVLSDGIAMFLGGIAFVRLPVVLRVFLGQAVHVVVTIGLGKYRSGSNAQVFAVALDDGGVWDVDGITIDHGTVGLESVAVNDDVLRAHLQLIQGTMHGQYGGIEDIDFVYFLRSDDTHRPRYGITLNDVTQLLTALVRQLFGVVQLLILIVFREDYGSSIYATR